MKISPKCKCSKCLFKDCISTNYFQYNLNLGKFNLYCVVVFKWDISSSIIGFTLRNLLDNGQNKYKHHFEWIQNIGVYVKLCFVTPNG